MDLHNSKIVFKASLSRHVVCCFTIFISLYFSTWHCLERHILHLTCKTFYHINVFGIREVLPIKTREGIVEMFWDHLRQKCQISFCCIETLICIGIYASIINSLLKYYHIRSVSYQFCKNLSICPMKVFSYLH